MKNEDIYDGITDIRDDIIDQTKTHAPQKAKPRRRLWLSAVAAVLVVALVGGMILWPGGSPLVTNAHAAYAIAEAEYPEMAPYPTDFAVPPDPEDYLDENGELDSEKYLQAILEAADAESEARDAWRADRSAQLNQPEGYADGLDDFFAASIQKFLSGAGAENRVYSPLNVYMALGMLAELTDGNSRKQVLDLLGADSMEALRAQASAVWNANYCDDGIATSILASSLWLNEDVTFVQPTMDTLAGTYYASSYQGEMGSDGFNQALQSWLNQQTGGLLEEQASGVKLEPSTILALASTVYFHAKWANEFSKALTEQGIFHAPGGDVTCDFMHQSAINTYYWGDRFSAVAQVFSDGSGDGSAMWFILPDEGVSVDELLDDEQAMDFLLSNRSWENSAFLTVNLSVPKFDVVSDSDLIPGLRELGVTDVFDASVSDFTPMSTDTKEICVSQVEHAARVMIDEEGCTAAAYAYMGIMGGSPPLDEEVDFVVDRPFLFVITSAAGQPLFTGVVNQPA